MNHQHNHNFEGTMEVNMGYSEEYKRKKVSAKRAVKAIKSGDFVDYGWCVTTPEA